VSFDGQGAPAGPERFAETAVLYAYMNGDPDKVGELLTGMLDGELAEFYSLLSSVLDITVNHLRSRRAPGTVV
jgi:hypothetical protein